MNTLIYIIIFLIGIFFGSFYTLAVYRIPKKIDIVKTHSYCPNCNHKLGILDLFPIFSYIFLRGKCRYCKQKIRPRYLVLELLSGIIFVLIAISIKLNIYNLEITPITETHKIIYLGLTFLYITALIIIAGIDKENKKISEPVLLYGICISFAYIIYLYILGNINIYRYAMYLIILLIIVIANTIYLRKKAENNYALQTEILCMLMIIYTGELTFVLTAILTLLSIAIRLIMHKISQAKKKNKKTDTIYSKNMGIAFYLCISNIIMLIITNIAQNYF